MRSNPMASPYGRPRPGDGRAGNHRRNKVQQYRNGQGHCYEHWILDSVFLIRMRDFEARVAARLSLSTCFSARDRSSACFSASAFATPYSS
jgi:hypothetical protein